MITNTELTYAIQHAYPKALPFENFWVGTLVDEDRKEVQDAEILEWHKDDIGHGQPKDVAKLVSEHPLPLDNIKQDLLDQSNGLFHQYLNESVSTTQYPDEEEKTWPMQLTEARARAGNPDAPTPWLSAIAEGRGISVADLAESVLQKAQELQTPAEPEPLLTGRLIGIRHRVRDMINAAATVEALRAIDIEAEYAAATKAED